ncbi:MAG TPA: ABC transporter C-terminal domain-containing protein, partial [Opitutaceae bacterium]|nr:ABC transporter C-terminal domain-containing protein [Opitutaceae bacterium]
PVPSNAKSGISPAPTPAVPVPAAAPAPAKRRGSPNEIKRLHAEVHKLEEDVARLEAKQNELTAALEAPETYSDKGKFHHLNRELSVIVDEVAAATAAWEKAAQKLADLERE